MAAILKICKQGARGNVEHAHAGLFRYIFKGAVAAIAIKAIGQAGRLADVQVIEAVVVVVAHCNAVVAINVDADGSVENGSPVIGAVQKLVPVGFNSCERVCSHVFESGTIGAADRLLAGSPLRGCPRAVFVAVPLRAPRADAFFTLAAPSQGYDVIANIGLHGHGSAAG